MLRVQAVSLAGLIVLAVVAPVTAQREIVPREIPPRTILVDVTQGPPRFGGGPNDRFLTFSMPVEVPGASLVAGTYLFRLVTPTVLQVVSADRSRVYTTFFALRTDGDRDGRERIRLQEPDDFGPLRILAWYPGDSLGYEFVYPKAKRESVDRRERE